MNYYLTKIVAVIMIAMSSTASRVNKKNTRATLDKPIVRIDEEMHIDIVNKIQLEDQAFWERSLSMSAFTEGDSSYKSDDTSKQLECEETYPYCPQGYCVCCNKQGGNPVCVPCGCECPPMG